MGEWFSSFARAWVGDAMPFVSGGCHHAPGRPWVLWDKARCLVSDRRALNQYRLGFSLSSLSSAMDIRLTRVALPLGGVLFILILLGGVREWRQNRAPSVAASREVVTQETVSSSTAIKNLPSSSTTVLAVTSSEQNATTVTRLLFVGDIMLDRNVAKRMKDAKDAAYPFRKLPSEWFQSFDYVVANLEGPVTDKRRPPEKSIDFQFDPSVIPMLKEQGIDAFSQANNHALDQGAVGYEDSVRRLQDAGFLVFGHQVHDDVVALATTTVNGIRFAFLGFNTTDNILDEPSAEHVIQLAREQADQVIVFMHWGIEYKHDPTLEMRERAHWFIDHGVDVVMGGHPHWVQGVEKYKGKPIIYSLGNFVFDQDFSTETRQGMAMELRFDDSGLTLLPKPIDILLSQPTLVEGDALQRRLKEFSSYSDPDLSTDILRGAIFFPRSS